MRIIDPLTRLSEHFILADFLGCHSVYSKGYPNTMVNDRASRLKLDNGKALCGEILEKVLDGWGPFSISYGYIDPELSDKIVRYQDPRKPSHHLWSLGAAADVCVHDWVNNDGDEASGSPIALAHGIDKSCLPYSRLITYSESPYICLAASAQEIAKDQPRQAFYENRFTGTPKVKPDYRQYATRQAKDRAYAELERNNLAHGWRGAGHPTHHCGGFRQYHHMRVSDYTMVSDWLLDLKSISNGAKNVPCLNNDAVQDAFAAAGMIYDRMLELSGCKRLSIIAGYVSHINPNFDPERDWRGEEVTFEVVVPASIDPGLVADACSEMEEFVEFQVSDTGITVIGDINGILSEEQR